MVYNIAIKRKRSETAMELTTLLPFVFLRGDYCDGRTNPSDTKKVQFTVLE